MPRLTRSIPPLALCLVVSPFGLAAQNSLLPAPPPAPDTGPPALVCFRGAPAARCRTFLVTNFGVYNSGFVMDWGWMVNVTGHDAIGASLLFVNVDSSQRSIAFRYRRWLSSPKSLEVAVGAPLSEADGTGFALIEYRPTGTFGLVVRPALGPPPARTFRVSGGIELSEAPGAALTALWLFLSAFVVIN